MDLAPAWIEQAKCSSINKDLAGIFFSEKVQDIAKAKAVCASCPVLGPCLKEALDREEPCGVWGGQLFSEGKIMAAKRNRGRPSKNAKQSDAILPTVEVPEYLREQVTAVTIAPTLAPTIEKVAA